MLSDKIITCEVIRRRSTFVVELSHDGKVLRGLLRNTGKLDDVIYPGSKVVCELKGSKVSDCRIIGKLIDYRATILDTDLQVKAFEHALQEKLIPWLREWKVLRRNVLVYNSRFDFEIVKHGSNIRGIVELKSAEYYDPRDSSVQYPASISLRGRRHIVELSKLAKLNIPTFLVFIAAHPLAKLFRPCNSDPKILPLLRHAIECGVIVKAIKMYFNVKDASIYLVDPDLPIALKYNP